MSFYFEFKTKNIKKIFVRTPIMQNYYELSELIRLQKTGGTDETQELYRAFADILSDNLYKKIISQDELENDIEVIQLIILINKYIEFVQEILKSNDFKIPYCPQDSEDEPVKYECTTGAERRVYEYTGINFTEQLKLRVDEFYRYLRDSVIYKHGGSKEGREYLEDCWMLEQTEPDTEALRAKFGKKGV